MVEEPTGTEPDYEVEQTYAPPAPRNQLKATLQRIFAPLAGAFALLLKLGGLAKFATVFVAFGGYTLIWGWKFALGVVLLIFVHEMGHFIEAKREGLDPGWPVFIPFLGAYVKHTRGDPWQTTRVAIGGPVLGGLAAVGCYTYAQSSGSNLMMALAYTGFVLNLFNMIPIGMLDGGAVWRSTKWLWLGGGRDKAMLSAAMYVTTLVVLAYGAYEAYLPQHRL